MANGRRNSIYASVASQEGATGGAAKRFQGPLIGFENAVFLGHSDPSIQPWLLKTLPTLARGWNTASSSLQ